MYNSIRYIIFDLDGVLVDSRELHYKSLNCALQEEDPKYIINIEEHLSKYDGLPTTKKLELLTKEKGLSPDRYNYIWCKKQEYSGALIKTTIIKNEKLRMLLLDLISKDYKLFCCSNSIKSTLQDTLICLGIYDLFTNIYSNEDVKNCKPHPEIYIKCFCDNHIIPQQCVIFEDSPIGRTAAYLSGAHLCPIANPEQLLNTPTLIYDMIHNAELINSKNKIDLRWLSTTQVVIPMAGQGSRFMVAGYKDPKPLIDINGKLMIEVVIENLNLYGAKYIFIVRTSHLENKEWNLREKLEKNIPNCIIVPTDILTEGPACSVLLAENVLDMNKPLLIANSDQYLEWDINSFMYESQNIDGCVSVFNQPDMTNTKWSYVNVNKDGYITELKEKEPISTIASTGIYYWKTAGDFCKYAKQMISKNIRVNNEFYVGPVYNEAINDGKKYKVSYCKKMWGLGVPDDLSLFLKSKIQ